MPEATCLRGGGHLWNLGLNILNCEIVGAIVLTDNDGETTARFSWVPRRNP